MSGTGQKQQEQQGYASAPPEAVALPYTHNQQSNAAVGVVYQASGASTTHVALPPRQHGAVHALPVQGSQAICRRCNRPFTRPPNAHDAMAQYYQCQNCNTLRVEDFCAVM